MLDEYEQQVTYKTISKKQYVKIVTLFKMGCVHDLTLYYRFEKLKKQDNINYHQRIYRYGRDFGQEINLEKLSPESSLLDDTMAYSLIIFGILHGTVQAQEVDPDTERFHQKFKTLYKHTLKCKMGGLYKYQHINSLVPTGEDIYDNATAEDKVYISSHFKNIPYLQSEGYRERMLTYERNRIARELLAQRKVTPEFAQEVKRQEKNEAYNILRSGYMQKVLGFSREELNKSVNEAKKEFVIEFAHYFERLSLDTFAIDLSDTK
ncbi:hypothetical protein KBC03_02710 [Patescibacteria group bacterium]|nr:hypothetical protein [Patescibacteria group bacterium]